MGFAGAHKPKWCWSGEVKAREAKQFRARVILRKPNAQVCRHIWSLLVGQCTEPIEEGSIPKKIEDRSRIGEKRSQNHVENRTSLFGAY